jgi:hypothetical protein
VWHGFLGQSIAATAKTLNRIGIALLLGAVAPAAYGARTFSEHVFCRDTSIMAQLVRRRWESAVLFLLSCST